MNFEQDNLTVQQYATKFTSLPRHDLYLVEVEDRRGRKFQDGLKPEIQEKISILNIGDYYEMVDRALLIEKNDWDIQRKRARLSGTRPNLSNWQGGSNLNTGDTRENQEEIGEGEGVGVENFEYPFCAQELGIASPCPLVRMTDREARSLGKDADDALKDMYVILGRMISCMENQQNKNLNHRGSNHDLERQCKSEMLKNFMIMHPPEFVGESDSDKAGNCIRNLEKIFETMGLNDEMKLLLATFRLENDAACWWEMIDSKWIVAQTVRAWELFLHPNQYLFVKVRMTDREASASGKGADNALKDMYVILGHMVSCVENKQHNNLNHRGSNHDLEGQCKSEMLKNFMNMHPPEFVGESDSDKAGNCIRNLEKIFEPMGLNDEMKLLLATFRLENDAACWWEMIESKWIAAQIVRTWELFKTEFNKNYIPRRIKQKREVKFMNFEQVNLTVQ
ncbi:hypothetical protein RJ640_027083 [Escallonia rubra]|uniref:Retrotransposon gag domain-containing protein n=1 Tax=Escallonia rubra TaxID=112253 RepID=A0AA88R0C6_9ASTE|nr:hypothetical protein RJ640_027083 [Escallonia rubra]